MHVGEGIPFPVDVAPDGKVHTLKKMIAADQFHPTKMDLYRVDGLNYVAILG